MENSPVLQDAKQKTYSGTAAAGSYIGKTLGSLWGVKYPDQIGLQEEVEGEDEEEEEGEV